MRSERRSSTSSMGLDVELSVDACGARVGRFGRLVIGHVGSLRWLRETRSPLQWMPFMRRPGRAF